MFNFSIHYSILTSGWKSYFLLFFFFDSFEITYQKFSFSQPLLNFFQIHTIIAVNSNELNMRANLRLSLNFSIKLWISVILSSVRVCKQLWWFSANGVFLNKVYLDSISFKYRPIDLYASVFLSLRYLIFDSKYRLERIEGNFVDV